MIAIFVPDLQQEFIGINRAYQRKRGPYGLNKMREKALIKKI